VTGPARAEGTGFGVDIGGTGVKAAPVDLATGKLLADRLRIKTPHPATPEAVADVVADAVKQLGWTGPIGSTFPAVVKSGVTKTAANVDPGWVDADAAGIFGKRLGVPVTVVNDADAAGLAEARFGAAAGHRGVVLLLTLGTGIGSALLLDGQLVPNTELGHMEVNGGREAEKWASEIIREKKDLSWKEWAHRLSIVLQTMESLLWPDLIVLGGGVSKEPDKFVPLLDCRTPVVAATLANDAGIVGAALYDAETRGGRTAAPTTDNSGT